MKEEMVKEIRGEEFLVKVSEFQSERTVRVIHKETYEQKKNSYLLNRDKRFRKKGGLFSEDIPLPPREEHIADAINEGVAHYFNMQNKKRELRDDMEAVLDASKEVYEDI